MEEKEILSEEELNKVSGGNDGPEEFDWKPKGYQTPSKDQGNNSGWKFEAFANTDGQYFKKTTSGFDVDNDDNNQE